MNVYDVGNGCKQFLDCMGTVQAILWKYVSKHMKFAEQARIFDPRQVPSLPQNVHTTLLESGEWVLYKASVVEDTRDVDIRVPSSWHRVFVLEVGGTRCKYTWLPFGWKHYPAIRQSVVRWLVASAISGAGVPVGHKVYLDDILLDAKRRRLLRRGRRAVVRKLR